MDGLLDLTRRVEETHFWFRGFHRFVAPAIAELAAERRDLRLLDCGCGTGHNLVTLLGPHGLAYGFDLTAGGLAYARASGARVARADMSAIPFQSGRFDIVTSFDVLQLVPDDAGAMREMARVLKPGGGLVVTATALEVLRGGHAGTWSELRRYTTGRMREIVEAAGLRVDRLTYLFAVLFPALLAVRMLRLNEGHASPEVPGGPDTDWEMQVPPAPINEALTWMLRGEAALSRHVRMPVGSSVLVVARK